MGRGAGPSNPARVDTIAGCSAIGGDSDVGRRHTQGAAPVIAVDNDAAVAEGAPSICVTVARSPPSNASRARVDE